MPNTHSMCHFLIQFHCVELRSTMASLLDSQPCKYICMYISCYPPHAHLMHLLPQNHVLKAHSNIWVWLQHWRSSCTCYRFAYETHKFSSGPYPFYWRRYYWWCGHPWWCKIESVSSSALSLTCTTLGRSLLHVASILVMCKASSASVLALSHTLSA